MHDKVPQRDSMKKIKKRWTYRGGTKAVTFRLPQVTRDKLDRLAKDMDTSKVQVIIEAIDEKGEG